MVEKALLRSGLPLKCEVDNALVGSIQTSSIDSSSFSQGGGRRRLTRVQCHLYPESVGVIPVGPQRLGGSIQDDAESLNWSSWFAFGHGAPSTGQACSWMG
jgi:hypothetical protein